jgi:hypothetical protein
MSDHYKYMLRISTNGTFYVIGIYQTTTIAANGTDDANNQIALRFTADGRHVCTHRTTAPSAIQDTCKSLGKLVT